MEKQRKIPKARKRTPKAVIALLLAAALAIPFSSCQSAGTVTDSSGKKTKVTTAKLDPKDPVTLTVWHYYNGEVMYAFDNLVKEFNETVGVEQGIIVEGVGIGDVIGLRDAVFAAARKDVGSQELPNIFASYPDTAYAAQRIGLLADIGQYISDKNREQYITSYIDEGRIGLHNELRIFPIAKSTEVFLLNETAWKPFADACGFTHDDLATVEGVVRVAEAYYKWTDAQTPAIPNDGKAFSGRDSLSNMFLIGFKQLGVELFEVATGSVTINADKEVLRQLWDTYYVPYISGHFLSAGRFRSDDAKVGDIISYIGSTASAGYFPSRAMDGADMYDVEATILPAPVFANGESVIVQQGAGMVVTKGTTKEEYASIVFLKWFTDIDVNTRFAAYSGYMPVKKDANDYEKFMSIVEANGIQSSATTAKTLSVAFAALQNSEAYTSKAFDGGTEARQILDASLQDKAVADRTAVLAALAKGQSYDSVIALFNTEANFTAWADLFIASLHTAAGQ